MAHFRSSRRAAMAACFSILILPSGPFVAAQTLPSTEHHTTAISPKEITSSSDKANQDAANSKATSGDAAQKPIILDPSETPKKQNTTASADRTNQGVGANEIMHERNETNLTNFTLALAVATALLMLATGALWWETRKLASLAKQQAEDTKQALKISAEAAEAAVITAGANRAWLTSGPIEYTGVPNTLYPDGTRGDAYYIHVQLSNSGGSPALKAKGFMAQRVININEKVPVFDTTGAEHEADHGTLGPGAYWKLGPVVATPMLVAEMLAGDKRVFLYFRITYYDVYNEEVERVTEITFEMKNTGLFQDKFGMRLPIMSMQTFGAQNTAS